MNINDLTVGIYKVKTKDCYDPELPAGYIEIYEHPIFVLAYFDDMHDGEFHDCHLPLMFVADNIDYKLNKKQIAVLKNT